MFTIDFVVSVVIFIERDWGDTHDFLVESNKLNTIKSTNLRNCLLEILLLISSILISKTALSGATSWGAAPRVTPVFCTWD